MKFVSSVDRRVLIHGSEMIWPGCSSSIQYGKYFFLKGICSFYLYFS